MIVSGIEPPSAVNLLAKLDSRESGERPRLGNYSKHNKSLHLSAEGPLETVNADQLN
jgi:hypothetical protein